MKPYTKRLIERMAEVILSNDEPEKPYIDTLKSVVSTGDVWGNFVASVYVIKCKVSIDKHRFSLRRVLSRHSNEIETMIKNLKNEQQKLGSPDRSMEEITLVNDLLSQIRSDKTSVALFDMANAIASNEKESGEYILQLEKVTESNIIWKEFVKNVIQKKDARTVASNSKRIAHLFKRKKETIKSLVKAMEENNIIEETEIISSDEEEEENDELVQMMHEQTIQDKNQYELENIFFECNEYPSNYTEIEIYIDGININTISLETLSVNCWLDENIINGFLKLMEFHFNNPKILVFGSFFVQNLICNDTLSEPWIRWASRKNLWNNTSWILPVHQENPPHWSTMIIIPYQKRIVYLDPLDGELPGKLLLNTCKFMAMFSGQIVMNWSEWTLHLPNDVPRQTGSSGNCGVHLISWAYIIYSGVRTVFHERNMKSIRKKIAHAFVHYASGRFCHVFRSNRKMKNEWENVDDIEKLEIKVDKGAGVGSYSTFEFCASLSV